MEKTNEKTMEKTNGSKESAKARIHLNNLVLTATRGKDSVTLPDGRAVSWTRGAGLTVDGRPVSWEEAAADAVLVDGLEAEAERAAIEAAEAEAAGPGAGLAAQLKALSLLGAALSRAEAVTERFGGKVYNARFRNALQAKIAEEFGTPPGKAPVWTGTDSNRAAGVTLNVSERSWKLPNGSWAYLDYASCGFTVAVDGDGRVDAGATLEAVRAERERLREMDRDARDAVTTLRATCEAAEAVDKDARELNDTRNGKYFRCAPRATVDPWVYLFGRAFCWKRLLDAWRTLDKVHKD